MDSMSILTQTHSKSYTVITFLGISLFVHIQSILKKCTPNCLNTIQRSLQTLSKLFPIAMTVVALAITVLDCVGLFLSGTYQLDEATRLRNGKITLHQLTVLFPFSIGMTCREMIIR